MKSLTHKLVLIFAFMAVFPLITGINAALSMRTARDSLDANGAALRDLGALLDSSMESIGENMRLQESASSVINQIANSQHENYVSLENMGDRLLPKTYAVSQIRFALAEATSAERGLLLALSMRHLEPEELGSVREIQTGNMAAALDTIERAGGVYEGLIASDAERGAWNEFKGALDSWRANHDDFMREIAGLEALVEDLVRGGPLFASASRRAYDTIFVRGKAARKKCENSIEVLNRMISDMAQASVSGAVGVQGRTQEFVVNLGREFEASSHRAASLSDQIESARSAAREASDIAAQAIAGTSRRLWLVVALSIFGAAAAAAIGIVTSRRVSGPVQKMVRHLARIAQGDLTEDVSEKDMRRDDEIGRLATAMQTLIQSTRQEIRVADALAMGDYTTPVDLRSESDQLGRALSTMLSTSNDTLLRVSDAVDRVDRGSRAMADSSLSLSRGAQTSAQALEEISQTANNVDAQAKDNAKNAREANELATNSRDAARRGYDAVTGLVSAMAEIQQAGRKIATVAKLIDDIAFQTNLLALNAAVEAARAGRQGKGFSVVADEVRNLSGRSAKAARETGSMVEAMLERMDAGALLAERTDAEFRDIVEATSKVAQIFQDITGASNAQSQAMAQIAEGLGQIDDVIQESTANAARTTASAESLTRQAGELRRMVSRFRLVAAPRRGRDFDRTDVDGVRPALTGPAPAGPPLLTGGGGAKRGQGAAEDGIAGPR